MKSRIFAMVFFAAIIIGAVLDAYDLLPSSRVKSFAFVTWYENYSSGVQFPVHRCRLHALIPARAITTRPTTADKELLRDATSVEVRVDQYCGEIANTWQPVKVDLQDPQHADFWLESEMSEFERAVICIAGGLLVLAWAGPRLLRYLDRWLYARLEPRTSVPAARTVRDQHDKSDEE